MKQNIENLCCSNCGSQRFIDDKHYGHSVVLRCAECKSFVKNIGEDDFDRLLRISRIAKTSDVTSGQEVCDICSKNHDVYGSSEDYNIFMQIDDNKMSIYMDNTDHLLFQKFIRFCPFCGRKLKT